MNKKEMKKLATLGVITGLMISSVAVEAADTIVEANPQFTPLVAGCGKNSCGPASLASKDTKVKSHKILSAKELEEKINEDARQLYQQLDQTHKDLALELANQDCRGKNKCKGLGGCEAPSMVGRNDCKGLGKCDAFQKDPNLAVKAAAQKMAEKRANATR